MKLARLDNGMKAILIILVRKIVLNAYYVSDDVLSI